MLVVRGGDLLDLNEVSIARTLIAQPSSMCFRRMTPPDGDSATPVRRLGAVIVTDDGLARAVAESDLVDCHSGTSPKVGVRAF